MTGITKTYYTIAVVAFALALFFGIGAVMNALHDKEVGAFVACVICSMFGCVGIFAIYGAIRFTKWIKEETK